ncbi:MAG TPA: hypothetical protein VNT81_22085 [Vicinamibacterales bacterium]|nr:hypothetical protein [Vicinamibacterales bacterium]
MSDAIPTASDPRATRLRTTNTLLALAILVLLGQVAWQEIRISGLKAEVAQARRDLDTRVEKMANEKVQGNRQELVAAVAFVDELYRSPEGLQRPGGLYNPDARQVDAEAIGTWILDVYMQARIAGRSDAEARQAIADAIKGSDEWRRKHASQ